MKKKLDKQVASARHALRRGQHGEAIRRLRDAAKQAPRRNDIRLELAAALRSGRQYQQAASELEAIIAADPHAVRAYDELGGLLLEVNDPEKAILVYRKGLERTPESVACGLGLARALQRMNRLRDALEALEKCYRQAPESPAVLKEYASLLAGVHRYQQARQVFARLAEFPEYREQAIANAAALELELARPEQALRQFEGLGRKAGPNALAVGARALNQMGQTEEAARLCRQALKQDNAHVTCWYELAEFSPSSLSTADLQVMESLLGKLPPQLRVPLYFAMARVYEYRQEPEQEMEMLRQGNELQRSAAPYRKEVAERTDEAFIRAQRGGFLEEAIRQGTSEVAPVFILGMPRSGTTLTEQILSSHSGVQPTGENRAIARALAAVGEELGVAGQDKLLRQSASLVVPSFIRHYLHYTREMHSVNGECFTDKSMVAHRVVPLLAAAFPRARFVRLSRNPMDLCLGCYRQLFNDQLRFSYDFHDCAHALASFNAVVEEWEKLLPDRIYNLVYERLVADQEGESRKLLEHVGLPWENQVLAFQENTRAVATASMQQVRQGLTSARVDRWRRYGKALEPLRRALQEHGVSVPEH